MAEHPKCKSTGCFQCPNGSHSNLLLVALVRGGLGLDAARPRLDLDLLPRPQARQVRAQVLQWRKNYCSLYVNSHIAIPGIAGSSRKKINQALFEPIERIVCHLGGDFCGIVLQLTMSKKWPKIASAECYGHVRMRAHPCSAVLNWNLGSG